MINEPTPYPSPPKTRWSIKCLDLLVHWFPRRLVPSSWVREKSKYTAHPTYLCRYLTEKNADTLKPGLSARVATKADLHNLMQHEEALDEDIYRRRLAAGDYCVVLTDNDQLVSFNWLTEARAGIYLGFQKEIVFQHKLAANCAFTYDFYTFSNHRNKGYGSELKKWICHYLMSKNITQLYTCVHADNHPSLVVHIKSNYQLVAVVYNARIMDWTCSFFSTKSENQRWIEWFNHYKQYEQTHGKNRYQ